jgi:hypothetical protein
MENSKLLFVAETKGQRRFVLDEILADLDLEIRSVLRRTGDYYYVLGFMSERWLRSQPVSVSVAFSVIRYAEARNGCFPSGAQLADLGDAARAALRTARKRYGRPGSAD